MSAFKSLPESDAWLDGWDMAASPSGRRDCTNYPAGTERDAFIAGWDARTEHIALGYLHDVPLPPPDV